MGALDTAVRQGKALYVGISSYSSEKTAEAAHILRALGTPALIHQPRDRAQRSISGDRRRRSSTRSRRRQWAASSSHRSPKAC